MIRLPDTIVFDLDGTLVDTGPDLTAALNHALGELGRSPVPLAQVRDMVGHGARKLLERGLAATGEMTTDLIDAGFPLFMDFYRTNICVHSVPYPGVERAMDALATAGARLAVCTNKPQGLSEQLLGALGWTDRFAAIVGADAVPERKPHPDHLLTTIARAGGERASTAYVGDSIVDVTTAKAADVPVIAVSFGFPDRPVETLGADQIIDNYDELIPALSRLGASATWSRGAAPA